MDCCLLDTKSFGCSLKLTERVVIAPLSAGPRRFPALGRHVLLCTKRPDCSRRRHMSLASRYPKYIIDCSCATLKFYYRIKRIISHYQGSHSRDRTSQPPDHARLAQSGSDASLAMRCGPLLNLIASANLSWWPSDAMQWPQIKGSLTRESPSIEKRVEANIAPPETRP